MGSKWCLDMEHSSYGHLYNAVPKQTTKCVNAKLLKAKALDYWFKFRAESRANKLGEEHFKIPKSSKNNKLHELSSTLIQTNPWSGTNQRGRGKESPLSQLRLIPPRNQYQYVSGCSPFVGTQHPNFSSLTLRDSLDMALEPNTENKRSTDQYHRNQEWELNQDLSNVCMYV